MPLLPPVGDDALLRLRALPPGIVLEPLLPPLLVVALVLTLATSCPRPARFDGPPSIRTRRLRTGRKTRVAFTTIPRRAAIFTES